MVLARLLLDANRPVSVKQLVEDVWGANPPRTAVSALQNSISALRKVLAPEAVRTTADGYTLVVDADQIDFRRFERLVLEAPRFAAAERAALLREALALWRGEPLPEVFFEPFAEPEVRRLIELRLSAAEDWVDAELEAGTESELVPELEALIARHPYREALHERLITLLYRAGRRSDALAAYRNLRRALLSELGLEPSPPLRELEQAILNNSLELADPPPRSRDPEFVASLFDEWAFSIGRGEWPDPRNYLDFAGADADRLAKLMDAYVRSIPRPAAAPEDIERARHWLAEAHSVGET